MSEALQLFIKRFWTEYKPDPTPEDPHRMREVDWVAYAPIGSVQKTLLTEAVSRLSCVIPMQGRAAQNPAVVMAHMRWDAIKPHYEAWKAGREVPLDGTPLAAWPGISQEQAELLRMKGVRTVEQVAALTDTHRQSMGIPGLHDIIDNAKRFLAAQDKGAVARELADKDAKIADLQAQMAELIEMVKESQKAVAAEEAPKRRGRPPKAQEEVAA
jgi:uncharacterized coiled-coil protein SlyX